MKVSNNASYLLDLWLHDAFSTVGESTSVVNAIKHRGKVVRSFNVAKKVDTIFVFTSIT